MTIDLNETTNPTLTSGVGVGLKPAHYRDVLTYVRASDKTETIADLSVLSFFEVHAENFMGAGGPAHAWLTAIRDHYPLSVHGVGLSIGGFNPPDKDHLVRLRSVVERYEPFLVSEHLAWCVHEGVFYNDLIAPPMTEESLQRICEHVDMVQSALGRRILIENPSQYLKLPADMSEPAFLNAVAETTGCGVLLDINNIYVSAHNIGFDAGAYLDAIDPSHVGEIHLAGHAIDEASGLRIDDHGSSVPEAVGELYKKFVQKAGVRPTLIEWDTDTPPLSELVKEVVKAITWIEEASPLCPDVKPEDRLVG